MSSHAEIGPSSSLFVETSGEGPPIILVGGLGDDHTLFGPLVPLLRDRWTCVAFDNRGTGASTALPDSAGIADLADDVHRLVDQLGVRDAIAVGCSMGGMVVQEWALRHPGDLTAAVLISTHARPGRHSLAALDHWERLCEANQTDRLMESLALFSCSPSFWEREPNLADDALTWELAPGFLTQLRACRHHDTLERLAQIQIPTLVMAGAHDQLIPVARAEELANSIPHSELRVLPTGHVPFWEQPQESADAIGTFCSSAQSRGKT